MGLFLIKGILIGLLFGKEGGEQKESFVSGGVPLFFSSFAVGISRGRNQPAEKEK